jgi:hypothetical protein
MRRWVMTGLWTDVFISSYMPANIQTIKTGTDATIVRCFSIQVNAIVAGKNQMTYDERMDRRVTKILHFRNLALLGVVAEALAISVMDSDEDDGEL